jgi:hypothetical protein
VLVGVAALRKTDSVVAMDWIMKADVRGPITSTPLWFKLYGQNDVVVEHDVCLTRSLLSTPLIVYRTTNSTLNSARCRLTCKSESRDSCRKSACDLEHCLAACPRCDGRLMKLMLSCDTLAST